MGSSRRSMVNSFSTSACCCKRTSSPPPPATDATGPPQISDPSQLNRFIKYIRDLLNATKMESSHQSASTSSASAEFIEHVKFAGKTMEKISTEAEQFKNSTKMLASKLPEEARRAVTGSLIGLGQLHWIGVAFSFVAFVLERMDRVSSNKADCIKLLEKIIDLAKIIQKLNERMSDDDETSERLKQAVHTIVEGAIICCCYMRGRKIFRYLTAVTVGESLKSTRDSLRDLTSELNLLVSVNIQAQQPLRKLQSQNILRISDPVGLSGPCEKVKELLDMDGSGSAKAVIIYGFGGIGKTTLAEYVVSELPLNGLKLCVIRIEDENFDIIKLQKQILFDVGGRSIELRNRMEGHKELACVLKEQLCFLFIDNVVKKRQVEDLLPQEFCLPSRSRMLITSRNSDVKEVLPHNIGCEEYHAGCLLPEEAKQLLHKIVFNNVDQVTADDELKIKDIAEACGGVPLLLRVYGGHLRRDRSELAYKEALESLKEGERGRYVEEEISKKLLYVYHHMKNEDAKDAFLDICNFFNGWDLEEVSFIVGEYELRLLQEGALVEITKSNEVIVHDVLKLLGINEAKGTRFRTTADLSNALDYDDENELEKIKGIWLDDTSQIFNLDSRHLNKMRNSLRILNVGNWITLEGQCDGRKFKNLRFVRVGDLQTFPFKDPSKLEKLSVLHDESMAEVEPPETLKQLRLIPPLDDAVGVFPSRWRYIKNLGNLQKLEMKGCKLIEFPEHFVLPAALTELDLTGCKNLKSLPILGHGQPSLLMKLNLDGCSKLKKLPENFGGLRSLKLLSMRRCWSLRELPQGFGQLTDLKDLRLDYCENLNILPPDFGGLCSLRGLSMLNCSSLRELPQGFGQLTDLTDLRLDDCTSLNILPPDFGGLRSPRGLSMLNCSSLRELPQGFGQLTDLTDLKLGYCRNLNILPPDFGGLRSLKILDMPGCERLRELPQGFGQLNDLTHLDLTYCTSLNILPPDFGGLMSLKSLDIDRCKVLERLPAGFGNLPLLESLNMTDLECLLELPESIRNLSNLTELA